MTFLAPFFLLAAAAGIIPVVLHMINRQKAKDLPFSTLRFLRVSAQKTRRRKHIHDMFLMLVRVAVLLLIAAGLAGPTVTNLQAFFGGAGTAVAIVLDNSASMGAIDNDKQRFVTALAACQQIYGQLADGDQIALLPTGGKPFPEQGKLDRTHEQVYQMLQQVKVGYERADVGARVEEARSLLLKSDLANRQIFVVSDFQANTWESFKKQETGGAALVKDEKAKAEEAKRTAIPVIMVDVNQSPRPNVAVTKVEVEAAIPVAGVPMKAMAELYNAAPIPQQRRVELYIDDTLEASSPSLNIPPYVEGSGARGGTVRHEFIFTFKGGGLHKGEVRLVGDEGNKLDDRRYFTIEVDQGIPVAVVQAQHHEIRMLEDTFYLDQALGRGRGGGWAIRASELLVTQLPSEPLNNYKVIYLVDLPALDEETAEKLRTYIERGGNVVWSVGDNVKPDAYNEMNQKARNQLLPAALVDVRTPQAGSDRLAWTIGSLDKEHPALKTLVEPPSLYQSVQVFKHIKLDVPAGSGGRVLARLDDGEPLMAQAKFGKGTATLLGTDLHSWSTLPRKQIFTPLIALLTFNLSGVEQAKREGVAGVPITLNFEHEIPPREVEIIPPSGETIRLDVTSERNEKGEQVPIFRYRETYDVGIYQMRLLEGVSAKQFGYAVNVDPDEADPVKIKRDDLQELFGKTPLLFAANPDELTNTFTLLRQGRSLWSLFLWLVLGFLVFETFLANFLSQKKDDDALAQLPPGMRRLARKGLDEGFAPAKN